MIAAFCRSHIPLILNNPNLIFAGRRLPHVLHHRKAFISSAVVNQYQLPIMERLFLNAADRFLNIILRAVNRDDDRHEAVASQYILIFPLFTLTIHSFSPYPRPRGVSSAASLSRSAIICRQTAPATASHILPSFSYKCKANDKKWG